jgi:SAM-dependent methyltransferase
MTLDTASLSPDEIRQRVTEFEWYHRIDLGHGIVTPGIYDLQPLLGHYGIPDSLAGRRVLDVGPAHGFFAFEFERRGAEVVTAELPSWSEHDAHPEVKAAAEAAGADIAAYEDYHHGALGFAIRARRSRVERRFCNVYDLSPERVGTFDIVFCASVLLHLTDPIKALYGIRRVCRDHALICTGVDHDPQVAEQPRAMFVGRPNGHAFWLPTISCLEQMALAAGFVHIERVSRFNLTSVDGQYSTPHGTIRAITY